MSTKFHSDLDRLDELANGYRAAQVLFAACRLDLFGRIGDELLSAEAVAERVGASSRGTRILLNALVGLGLLVREKNRYCNSVMAQESLRDSGSAPRLSQMLHGARLYDRWAGLFDAVVKGQPVPRERVDSRLSEQPRDFARAMAESARTSARLTAEALDFAGVRRILDIGGGPGIYAIEMARRTASATCTVLDHPEALEVAELHVRQAGLADRIHLIPGDAFTSSFGGPFDLILVSNVVHIFSSDQNRVLIDKCARSLSSSGRLVLKDFFLDDVEDGPAGPAWNLLFAVNMLVATEAGECYSAGEVREWCRLAGLSLVQRIPLTERTVLLVFRPV